MMSHCVCQLNICERRSPKLLSGCVLRSQRPLPRVSGNLEFNASVLMPWAQNRWTLLDDQTYDSILRLAFSQNSSHGTCCFFLQGKFPLEALPRWPPCC